MKVCKSPHNKSVILCLDNLTYTKHADVYSGCKRWGARVIYTFLGRTELIRLVKEIAQGTVGL